MQVVENGDGLQKGDGLGEAGGEALDTGPGLSSEIKFATQLT
jgi:hypothetical protein